MTQERDNVLRHIENTIQQHNVVLFMKGTKHFPQCGFSADVVQVLNHLDVDFFDVNVLSDDAIRSGIKEYSDWPTIPQLYVKQQFIGGCDIVREMLDSGELQTLFAEKITTQY